MSVLDSSPNLTLSEKQPKTTSPLRFSSETLTLRADEALASVLDDPSPPSPSFRSCDRRVPWSVEDFRFCLRTYVPSVTSGEVLSLPAPPSISDNDDKGSSSSVPLVFGRSRMVLDPRDCARHGWIAEKRSLSARRSLRCISCNALIVLPPSPDTESFSLLENVSSLLNAQLVSSHRTTCRFLPCPLDVCQFLPPSIEELRHESRGIEKSFSTAGIKSDNWDIVSLPLYALELFNEIMGLNNKDAVADLAILVDQYISPLSLLGKQTFNNISVAARLLAIFGWTATENKSGTSASLPGCVRVRCNACGADVVVSRFMTPYGVSRKRRRSTNTTILDDIWGETNRRTMDPIKEHRFFCPFVAGAYGLDSTSREEDEAGWKIMMRSVARRGKLQCGGEHLARDTDDCDNVTSGQRHVNDSLEAVRKIWAVAGV